MFKITEAALGGPDGLVRRGGIPGRGRGGHAADLLAEYQDEGHQLRQHKQRVFKASYTNHYRTGLIELLRRAGVPLQQHGAPADAGRPWS